MSAELKPTSGDCVESPPEPWRVVTLSQSEEHGLDHEQEFFAVFTGSQWRVCGGRHGFGQLHLPASALVDVEWQYAVLK